MNALIFVILSTVLIFEISTVLKSFPSIFKMNVLIFFHIINNLNSVSQHMLFKLDYNKI